MSRKTMVRVLVAALASLSMLAAMLGFASAPANADGDTETFNGGVAYPADSSCTITQVVNPSGTVTSNPVPPPPVCFDPSGSDQDEVLEPPSDDDYYRFVYYIGSTRLSEDEPYSTKGQSVATVEVWDNGVPGVQSPGYSTTAYQLTFNTAVTVPPAPNDYWAEVGDECKDIGYGDYRELTIFVKNNEDAGKRFIHRIWPDVDALDGSSVPWSDQAFRVQDGQTAGMHAKVRLYGMPGVWPGKTYKVKVWESDYDRADSSDRVVANLRVTVPNCDGTDPTDPTDPGHTVKPKGDLRQTGKHKVRAVMKKGSASAVPFRVLVQKPHRKAKVRNITLSQPRKVLVMKKLPKGTRVVLSAKWGGTWHKLEGKKVQGGRS